MMRRLVYGVMLAGTVCLAAPALAFRVDPVVYVDDFELERRSLEAIDGMLSAGLSPRNADLAIGLSEAGLAKLGATLEGISATAGLRGSLTLRIEDVELQVRDGHLHMVLSIKATRNGSPMVALLTARAVMFAEEIVGGTGSDGEAARVSYRVAVREIAADLTGPSPSAATREWVNRVVAANVGRHFVEDLTFSLPIGVPVDFGLSLSDETTRTEQDGSFTVRYSMDAPGLAGPKRIRVAPGIPANGAVWFLASLADEGEGRSEGAVQGETNPVPIGELRERVLGVLATFPEVGGELAMYLNRVFLDRVVDEFNGLSEEERTIHAEVTSSEGYLKESYDELERQGSGGYSVRFPGNGSVRGAASLSRLSSEWVEGKGLALAGEAEIRAEAEVKLRIDPYSGGGFETDIPLVASATVPLNMDLDVRLMRSGDRAAVMMGPVVECERFRLTLEEKRANLFGIVTDEFIGRRQADPWLVMGTDTRWEKVVEKRSEVGLVVGEDHWIGIRAVPRSVTAGSNGYRVLADIEPRLSVGKPEGEVVDPAMGERLAELWRQEVYQACPRQREAVFLFAGSEFGPDGDLLEVAKSVLMKMIDLSADKVKEMARDPKKAREAAEDILAKTAKTAGEWLEGFAQSPEDAPDESSNDVP